MRVRLFLRILFSALAILTTTASAFAQNGSVLHGVVRDLSGALVRAGDVKVFAPEQRVVGAAKTDDQGRFSIPMPQPGSYLVEVRAAGFTDVRTAVTVPMAEGQVLELTAGAPSTQEEVSVTAVAGQIQTATRLTQPVNVIDERDVQLRAKTDARCANVSIA